LNTKDKNKRIDIAAWSAVILGLLIGLLLKRMRWGMVIGIILGFVIISLLRKRKITNRD
jgi:F0F1-type ATP synthase assembly protein I